MGKLKSQTFNFNVNTKFYMIVNYAHIYDELESNLWS